MAIHPKLEADTFFVKSLDLSDLRLMNNQQYPWVILIPRLDNAIELIDLSHTQQHQLMDEMALVSRLMSDIYEADKLNIATIGNIVPQLHVHIVARYRTDAAWPSPVWGYPGTPYSEENLKKTIALLRA